MKKWTIAFVNYKSSVYLYWQFKMLFEFNDPNDFDVIVVDNSNPSECETIKEISQSYNDQYNNVTIVQHTPKNSGASMQHGEGLALAVKIANSTYFLAQDPDFFFIKQNYLNIMSSFLDKGFVAIGAPYTHGVALGHPKFPALYGAAHPLNLIKDIDIMPLDSETYLKESLRLYPQYEYSFDVGFKYRNTLSTADNITNFIAFTPITMTDLAQKIGLHSFASITQAYLLNDEEIAYHLFRGCFTGNVVDNVRDANLPISKKLFAVRNRFGEYFYRYISSGVKPY